MSASKSEETQEDLDPITVPSSPESCVVAQVRKQPYLPSPDRSPSQSQSMKDHDEELPDEELFEEELLDIKRTEELLQQRSGAQRTFESTGQLVLDTIHETLVRSRNKLKATMKVESTTDSVAALCKAQIEALYTWEEDLDITWLAVQEGDVEHRQTFLCSKVEELKELIREFEEERKDQTDAEVAVGEGEDELGPEMNLGSLGEGSDDEMEGEGLDVDSEGDWEDIDFEVDEQDADLEGYWEDIDSD